MGAERISPIQAAILLFLYAVGSAVLLMPSILIGISHQDAWITILLSALISVPMLWLYVRLIRRFPGATLTEMCILICGRWIGSIVSASFCLYFLLIGSLVLRDIGNLIATAILPQTPMIVTHILFLLPIVYGVKLGIEVIGRTGEIYLPGVLLLSIFVMMIVIPYAELEELRPIFAEGLQPTIKGLYPLISFPIAEYAVFLTILPFVNKLNKTPKYLYFSNLITVVYFSFLLLIIIAVEGEENAARSVYAIYEMTKQVKIGRFLERIEVLVGLIWVTTIFMKLSLLFYALNSCVARLFGLNDYRRLVLPLAMILLPVSLTVMRDTSQAEEWVTGVGPVYGFIQSILIPFLLLIIAAIRKLKLPREIGEA